MTAADRSGSTVPADGALARTCPHCGAANPLDLGSKCVRCRKRLPPYCFACYAPIGRENDTSCAQCGRRRWVAGDLADLRCNNEAGGPVTRPHAYMFARMKAGKVMHWWRCMTCYAEEDTFTDAFAHFPERPADGA
jgi:hypothetical protein